MGQGFRVRRRGWASVTGAVPWRHLMLAAATSSYGKDAMEPGFAAAEIDTSKPHPARMYNAYLGGNDNYPAGRRRLELLEQQRELALSVTRHE
jgi:S-adenosyl methyltransferase